MQKICIFILLIAEPYGSIIQWLLGKEVRLMAIGTVSIIGLGAEGSVAYYAARKTLDSEHVRVIAKGERAERLKKEGIIINKKTYELNVVSPGEGESRPDLLVVAVKGYNLPDILDDIEKELGEKTVIMSMINGLSSEETLARRFGPERVIYSMSKINSKKCANRVDFKPFGQVAVGEKDGSVSQRAKDIYALFSSCLPAQLSTDIYLDIWRKYMMNSACNTVEAIFHGQHCWFQKIPEACDAMRCVMCEIKTLANKMGIGIKESDIDDVIETFENYAPDGMCSMVQDVLNKKPTEIDMFMGEAMRMGEQYGVSLPVCRFVYDIIKSFDKVNAGVLD